MKCPKCKKEVRPVLVTTLSVTRYEPIDGINWMNGDASAISWNVGADTEEIDGEIEETRFECENCNATLGRDHVIKSLKNTDNHGIL